MKDKNKIKLLMVIYLLIIAFFAILLVINKNQSRLSSNLAKNGVLDLQGETTEENENIFLEGEWEFYWQEFIITDKTEDENENSNFIYASVPNEWSHYKDNEGNNYPSTGYGSYRLLVKNNSIEDKLVFNIQNLNSSFRLFIDGNLILTSGVVSTVESEIFVDAQVLEEEIVLPKGDFEIVIEISSNGYSGLTSSPYFTIYDDFLFSKQLNTLFLVLIIGILIGVIVIRIISESIHYSYHGTSKAFLFILLFGILTKLLFNRRLVSFYQMWGLNISYDIISFAMHIVSITLIIALIFEVFYLLDIKKNNIFILITVIYYAFIMVILICSYTFKLSSIVSMVIDALACLPLIVSIFYLFFSVEKNKVEYRSYYIAIHIFSSMAVMLNIIYENYFIRYNLNFLYIALILACFLISSFINVLIGKKNSMFALRNQKLEKELVEANNLILMSQMKPHFLYNTLNTIKYLITIDPAKAEYAILNFSKYLRTNLTMLDKKENIPFMLELNYVDQYVKIEMLRFENILEVEYRIDCKDFFVPPLSVQPLVENAIKHGVTKKIGGGKVILQTYDDKDNFYVKIVDNGVGFDLQKLNLESQSIGLKNTKARIKQMLNGSLEISSEENEGTTVILILPKENNYGGNNESNIY